MRRALIPLAVLGVAILAVTWLVEPNLLIGLRSPRALVWAGALGLACVLVGLVAHRITRRLPVALAIAALPAAVATALVVVEPILNARTVDEALPTAAPAVAPSAGTPTSANPTSGPAPLRIASGTLRGLAGHDAQGRVSTYRLADGSHIVRFEDVDIGGTPSPHVYVVAGADRRDKGGTHLGELTAEKGSFNYRLPTGFRPSDFTVLVWCEQFAVEIANATQA